MTATPQQKYLSSFGRNRGRSLRPYQQGLVDELLPKLAVQQAEIAKIVANGAAGLPPLPAGEATRLSASALSRSGEGAYPRAVQKEHEASNSQADRRPHPDFLSAEALSKSDLSRGRGGSQAAPPSPNFTRIALEIGFGGGEHLLAQAAHNPDTLFIGCEPFINGVAKCLAGIDQQKLTNIRLFTRDARELIEALPDACLDAAFILFPDPWPKARHNKRRLVSAETLSMIARTHKQGGRLLIATDHVDYSTWILEVLLNHPDYEWTAKQQADWQTPPADWTQTKYQRKTSEEGRAPLFFECTRR